MVKVPDALENQPPPYGEKCDFSLCWTEMVEGGRWCEADLEVLVDNAWRTHDGRRGGEGCYDARRGVLHRDPRASPWPFRVTGMSYARARQRPKGLTVS